MNLTSPNVIFRSVVGSTKTGRILVLLKANNGSAISSHLEDKVKGTPGTKGAEIKAKLGSVLLKKSPSTCSRRQGTC